MKSRGTPASPRFTDMETALLSVDRARAKKIVNILLPVGDPRCIDPPMVVMAVPEDHYTQGERIITSALQAGGYGVIDYGYGVKGDQLVEQVPDSLPLVIGRVVKKFGTDPLGG